jgi:hypothetical protein
VARKWSSVAGTAIRFRKIKTGTVMELSIHPELAKALKHLIFSFLTTDASPDDARREQVCVTIA